MPKYTYKGRESLPDCVDPGDYIVRVIEAEAGISNGAKTRGHDTLKLKLKEENSGATFFEVLTFHESCDFKIDTFIRSTGIKAEEGKEIELNPPDLVGLRGWVSLRIDEYNGRKGNKVAIWLTDREKLDRVEPEFGDDDDDAPF
ncbi:MAG: hypothetical protein VW907_04015 [Opitutae bacterium]